VVVWRVEQVRDVAWMGLTWTIYQDGPDREMRPGDDQIKKFDCRVDSFADNQRVELHGEAGN
jgi:hypothetical protein